MSTNAEVRASHSWALLCLDINPYLKVKNYSNGEEFAPLPIVTRQRCADCCPVSRPRLAAVPGCLPRFGVGADRRRSRAVLYSSGDSATLALCAGGEAFDDNCCTYLCSSIRLVHKDSVSHVKFFRCERDLRDDLHEHTHHQVVNILECSGALV